MTLRSSLTVWLEPSERETTALRAALELAELARAWARRVELPAHVCFPSVRKDAAMLEAIAADERLGAIRGPLLRMALHAGASGAVAWHPWLRFPLAGQPAFTLTPRLRWRVPEGLTVDGLVVRASALVEMTRGLAVHAVNVGRDSGEGGAWRARIEIYEPAERVLREDTDTDTDTERTNP